MKNIKIYDGIAGIGYNWFSFACRLVFDFSIDDNNNIKIEQIYEPKGSNLKVKEEELQQIARDWLKTVDDTTTDDYKRQIGYLKEEIDYLQQQLDAANN